MPREKKKRKQQAEWYKLLRNLFGKHNMQLWFGALFTFVIYFTDHYLIEHDMETKPDNLYIGIVLLVFVLSFGMFSYYMDAKCDYYLETCRDFVSHYCTVIRDGIPREIEQQNLVVGDLVAFTTGDCLAADLKVVECSAVQINLEVLKECPYHYYGKLYRNLNRFYQVGDLLLQSTFVYAGHGKGVVMRTREFYTSYCGLTRHDAKHKVAKVHEVGPLTIELQRFLSGITITAIIVALSFASKLQLILLFIYFEYSFIFFLFLS